MSAKSTACAHRFAEIWRDPTSVTASMATRSKATLGAAKLKVYDHIIIFIKLYSFCLSHVTYWLNNVLFSFSTLCRNVFYKTFFIDLFKTYSQKLIIIKTNIDSRINYENGL